MRARTNATCRRECFLSAVDRFGGNRVRYSCDNAAATVTSYYYTGTQCEEGGRTTTTTAAAAATATIWSRTTRAIRVILRAGLIANSGGDGRKKIEQQ